MRELLAELRARCTAMEAENADLKGRLVDTKQQMEVVVAQTGTSAETQAAVEAELEAARMELGDALTERNGALTELEDTWMEAAYMGDAHADGGGGGCECTPPSSPEQAVAAAQWSADQRLWEASSRMGGIHSDTPWSSDTQRSPEAHGQDVRDLALMEHGVDGARRRQREKRHAAQCRGA